MPSYRCLFLAEDGQVAGIEAVALPNDEFARAWGESLMMHDRRFPIGEIWRAERRLSLIRRRANTIETVHDTMPVGDRTRSVRTEH